MLEGNIRLRSGEFFFVYIFWFKSILASTEAGVGVLQPIIFYCSHVFRTWPSGYGASFRSCTQYLLVRKSEGSNPSVIIIFLPIYLYVGQCFCVLKASHNLLCLAVTAGALVVLRGNSRLGGGGGGEMEAKVCPHSGGQPCSRRLQSSIASCFEYSFMPYHLLYTLSFEQRQGHHTPPV